MPNLPLPLNVREAKNSDQPFLDRLYRSSRDDLTRLGDSPAIDALISMQQMTQTRGQRNLFPNARHWLLWYEGEPVARMVLDETPQRLHIVDFTVLGELRGQGLGSALLQWAKQQANSARLPLELNVQRHNSGAQRLYHAHGFVRVAGDEVSDNLRWQA